MAQDRFVRYTPKQDGADQIISADHINKLQGTSEATQKAIYKTQDSDFMDKALFILEHHRSLNGLWADTFSGVDKVDLIKTTVVSFSEAEQAIVFPDGSTDTDGYLYSKTYVNPNGANMKKVMVIASASVPDNTDIIIGVSNNGSDFYEVALSDSDMFEIPTDGQKLKLRARFVRSDITVSPRLDSWCVLFRDSTLDIIEMPDGSKIVIGDPDNSDEYDDMVNIMHSQLLGIGPDDHHAQEHTHDGFDGSGLIDHSVLTGIGEDDHHSKDHVHGQDGVAPVALESDVVGTLSDAHISHYVWTGYPGTTGMFFDPKLGDRLVYVNSPDEETYMFYDFDNGGRLGETITITRGIAVWEVLMYGIYKNSQGQENVILQGTEKQLLDATDILVTNKIETMTAPKAPAGLVATQGNPGELILSWTANVEHDLVGYNIYMSTNNGSTWDLVNATGLVPAATFTQAGLISGATYKFHVTAIDTSGYESSDSAVVTGIPL